MPETLFSPGHHDQDHDQRPAEERIAFRTPGVFSVNGRFSLLCVSAGLCARGLWLRAIVKPKPGDRIDATFEMIGRIPGEAAEVNESGFLLCPDEDILARLREQVTHFMQGAQEEQPRRHFRIRPRNPETTIKLSEHQTFSAQVVDFSLSGACIETEAPLLVGDRIAFPRFTCAKVVRDLGARRFGVEFDRAFRPHEFTWYTRL